ncbi:MAG: universal stress protein [Nitrospirota bacterium]
MKISHILHPTDFSDGAEAALDYARALAKQYNASLTHLYVLNDISKGEGWYVPHTSLENFFTEMESEANKKLQHYCYEEQMDLKNVNSVILSGKPDDSIVDYAKKNGVDLIIMGSYSRSGMDFLFGSTTRKVLNKADCPVLCVKVPEWRSF